jgi:hypothetical protein
MFIFAPLTYEYAKQQKNITILLNILTANIDKLWQIELQHVPILTSAITVQVGVTAWMMMDVTGLLESVPVINVHPGMWAITASKVSCIMFTNSR